MATRESALLARHFAARRGGYCVEVGAYDGVAGSHTHPFETSGWRCLLVEADEDLAASCRAARPGSTVVQAAAVAPGSPPEVTFEIMENCRTLSSLAIGTDVTRRAPAWGLEPKI